MPRYAPPPGRVMDRKTRVYELVGKRFYTVREAAEEMGISKSTAHTDFWEVAGQATKADREVIRFAADEWYRSKLKQLDEEIDRQLATDDPDIAPLIAVGCTVWRDRVNLWGLKLAPAGEPEVPSDEEMDVALAKMIDEGRKALDDFEADLLAPDDEVDEAS